MISYFEEASHSNTQKHKDSKSNYSFAFILDEPMIKSNPTFRGRVPSLNTAENFCFEKNVGYDEA